MWGSDDSMTAMDDEGNGPISAKSQSQGVAHFLTCSTGCLTWTVKASLVVTFPGL